jgi:hypothetical protein
MTGSRVRVERRSKSRGAQIEVFRPGDARTALLIGVRALGNVAAWWGAAQRVVPGGFKSSDRWALTCDRGGQQVGPSGRQFLD